MIATTAPTERGTIGDSREPRPKNPTIHALDKHSGLPRCGAALVSVRGITKMTPIPVDTPRAELGQWLTCAPCLRELGA
jgi:hypothetical protein